MPILPKFDIGSDFDQTITITDSNGTAVPDANIQEVQAVVYINNSLKRKFNWVNGGSARAGFYNMTDETGDGIFSINLPGEVTKDWNAGLVEVSVLRILTTDDADETERFQVAMAQRVDAGTDFDYS